MPDEIDYVVPQRPSEFATDEEWAQALVFDKWELDDRVGPLEFFVERLERLLREFHNDRGDVLPSSVEGVVAFPKEVVLPDALDPSEILDKPVTVNGVTIGKVTDAWIADEGLHILAEIGGHIDE